MALKTVLGIAAASWAILGWSGILLFAILRLNIHAMKALEMDLTAVQLTALMINVVFMLWAEGYRGFQQRFSPRAAARVLYLRNNPDLLDVCLAPLFCIGYYHATPRVLRLAWIGTGLILLLVVLVNNLPQPWRGILDAGVVLGLSWGLLSFLLMSWRALRSGGYPVDPEVPGEAQRL